MIRLRSPILRYQTDHKNSSQVKTLMQFNWKFQLEHLTEQQLAILDQFALVDMSGTRSESDRGRDPPKIMERSASNIISVAAGLLVFSHLTIFRGTGGWIFSRTRKWLDFFIRLPSASLSNFSPQSAKLRAAAPSTDACENWSITVFMSQSDIAKFATISLPIKRSFR